MNMISYELQSHRGFMVQVPEKYDRVAKQFVEIIKDEELSLELTVHTVELVILE